MARAGVRTGRVEQYHQDQLVVALPHLREVRHRLHELRLPADVVGRDPDLGLALLALRDLHLVRQPGWGAAIPAGTGGPGGNAPGQAHDAAAGSDLDALLRGLRRWFDQQYDHWVPTMGKNRIVGRVAGAGVPGYVIGGGGVPGYVIGGGDEGPPEVDAGKPFAPRSAEPGSGVRVGVLDTALFQHPWLAGGYDAAPDSLQRPAPPGRQQGLAGHATFVAGLVLHRAPGARLDVRKVLGDEDATADTWTVARRMAEFARSGVDVLNLSLGCYTDDGEAPLVLARALERLGPELVVVVAAGNHGDARANPHANPEVTPRSPMWPAALDGAIAVGATDEDRKRAPFSPDTPWVAATAPGVKVHSTYLEGHVLIPMLDDDGAAVEQDRGPFSGFARWSGTSFAAAAVSGAIAAATRPGRRSAREVADRLLQQPEERDHDDKPFVL